MTQTTSPVTIDSRRDPPLVERVLRSLPEWFGIDEAIHQYVRDAADPAYESLTAWAGDRCIGVALISRHYPEAGELHLIAVDAAHRQVGVGRQLVERAAFDLVDTGAQLFSVHTVRPSYPDTGYAQTRGFYRSMGFLPLEEHRGLDWTGPTLILVKPLRTDVSRF